MGGPRTVGDECVQEDRRVSLRDSANLFGLCAHGRWASTNDESTCFHEGELIADRVLTGAMTLFPKQIAGTDRVCRNRAKRHLRHQLSVAEITLTCSLCGSSLVILMPKGSFKGEGRGRRRGSASARPRGAAPRQLQGRGSAARSQSQSRPSPPSPRPGWDEDTRAPNLFDTRLRRHIFQPYSRAAVESVITGPRPRRAPPARAVPAAAPHHKPGQLRRRIQVPQPPKTPKPVESLSGTEEAKRPEPELQELAAKSVFGSIQSEASEPLTWPKPFQTAMVSAMPEQLQVTHMQRRRAMASLGEKLAILLPDGRSESGAGSLLIVPPVPATRPPLQPERPEHREREILQTQTQDTQLEIIRRQQGIKLVDAPIPAKVQSLSQKLSALLGPPAPQHCDSPERRRATEPSQLLRQNAAEVVRKVDLLTDGVLEHLLGDAVSRLDALPETRPQQHKTYHAPAEACRPLRDEQEDRLQDPRRESLGKLVQNAEDRLEMLEQELKMTYLHRQESTSTTGATQEVRRLHASSQLAPEEEEEGWRFASLPAARIHELERYRARFARHCLAAREAGIQSGPGARTATWVIWPFLADSIAMAAVEAAIEEVDAAMEGYVSGLMELEIGEREDDDVATAPVYRFHQYLPACRRTPMPAGALKAALDSSFLVASSGAELRSRVGSPFDVSDADPVQDFSAWLQRLGGAVKQTILDWVHFPLPSGLDKVFGLNHTGPEDEGEASRLGAGPHPPGMSGPFPPRPSGIHAWHPTARNALYSEVNNPNQPEPPPNWPRGVTWPPRAVVDKNGKWWPPPGWANGVGAENGCGPARWIYSCGWRNRDDWGKDATSVWYDAAHQLAEAGNNPRRLLAKEARDDAAYLDRLRGFRSGRQGPPEPPRAAQVLEIDDGPLSPTAAKQFSMVEIVEQQGGSAAATAEEQAADTILDLQKSVVVTRPPNAACCLRAMAAPVDEEPQQSPSSNAEAKPRRRPLPLSDEEESGESEGEPAAVAYAAASGLPARQELDRGAASLPASLSNKVLQLQAMASNSSEVLYESQSQEASPQAGLPSLRRGRHAFPDEAEHMPLGRSPPLSPSGEAPRSEVEVPHDALHVGPLDFASSFGGVDPAVVYVRLSNFAARRRGSLRLQAAPEEADDGLEPFSPVIHAGTEPPTFMTDSRQKRRRSRSGSDYSQCSSPYGSSPNLQAVAEVSGEDLPGHKAIEESLPRHDSDDGRPADHLEHHSLDRCCTWNDYRRTSEGPAEEEEIASIQRHLEAMNAAAADLNAAQESLAACMRRQRTMVQLWAVVSARLARAVGSKQLAKVQCDEPRNTANQRPKKHDCP
eukprot:s582_g9.t2